MTYNKSLWASKSYYF